MSQDERTELTRVDLLVVGAAEVATARGAEALGGTRLAGCHVGKGWAVAVAGERIAGVGPEAELRARFQADAELDARGGTVVPGFVDSHTHPVFAGTREDEFEMRTGGATYVEIGLAGGGILSTVRGVREESREVLLAQLLLRMDRFLELGTTTVEAKSGYGLSTEMEIKMLRVIAEANRMHPVDLVPTFLGAHEYPEEYRDRRSDYVDLLVKEVYCPSAVAEGQLPAEGLLMSLRARQPQEVSVVPCCLLLALVRPAVMSVLLAVDRLRKSQVVILL